MISAPEILSLPLPILLHTRTMSSSQRPKRPRAETLLPQSTDDDTQIDIPLLETLFPPSSPLSSPPPELESDPFLPSNEDGVLNTTELNIPALSTKAEKVQYIVDILRTWRWSIPLLCCEWITVNAGNRQRYAKRRTAQILCDLFRHEIVRAYIQTNAEITAVLLHSFVHVIRQELTVLTKNCQAFQTYTPERSFLDMEMSGISNDIQQNAPVLYQLIKSVSAPQKDRTGQRPSRAPHPGRIVSIVMILLLGFARNSSNLLARCFGIYLHAEGVKRRTLSVLHGLGLIDSYQAIWSEQSGIAAKSQASAEQIN